MGAESTQSPSDSGVLDGTACPEDLQRLLLKISAMFIGISSDAVDFAIESALGEMARYVRADRAYVFRYDFQNGVCDNTHEWSAPGITPQIESLQGIRLDGISGWVEIHRRGQAFYAPDVAALPPGVDRDILLGQDIRSVVTVPMLHGDECHGFVGFDAVRHAQAYSERERNLLTLFAHILVNVRQRQITEAELRLKSRVLDQIQDLVTITDLEGTITFVNQAEVNLLGHPRESLMGKSTRVYGEDSTQGASQRDILALTLRDGHWRGEVVNYTADGQPRNMDCRTQVVHDGQGAPVALCGIATDITERKRLQAELMHAQKMESIGRLAGGIAHDFNNKLSIILGQTDLALASLPADHPVGVSLREIQGAAERSAELTRQLLAFARKQKHTPKVLDLNREIDGMIRMLTRLIGSGVRLAWRPETTPVCIEMDPGQVDQIVANLCVNARDAVSPTNGHIRIAVRRVVLENRDFLLPADCASGPYVRLSVADNGCGMSEMTMSHLFEPFFTTKEDGKGTGLGLSTVYGIVRQNRGFVQVASHSGSGSLFLVYLPLWSEPSGEEPVS